MIHAKRTQRQVTSQKDILEERKREGGGEGNGAGPTRLGYSEQVTMGLPLETRKVGGASFAAPGPYPSLPSFGTSSFHPRLPSSNLGCLPTSHRLPKGTQICLKNPWPGRYSSFFYRQLHHSPKWDGVWDRTWSRKGASPPCEALYKHVRCFINGRQGRERKEHRTRCQMTGL